MIQIVVKNKSKIYRWYNRVNDKKQIKEIENKSESWKRLEKDGYIILEQKNAKEKYTGFCKIIEKSSMENDIDDWIYYKRRSKKNEI